MFANVDETEINIGDKIFVYGQLSVRNDILSGEYNAIMGYMTVGGYDTWVIETTEPDACVPGTIIEVGDFLAGDLEINTGNREMIDVTDRLALQTPMPIGARVWMPTKP